MWRPIEAAPKDGTPILAFVAGVGMGHMVLFWFNQRWREPTECKALKDPSFVWQPLPEPLQPAQTEKEAA